MVPYTCNEFVVHHSICAAFLAQHRGAAVKKELGLEYEAVADHPDIRVVTWISGWLPRISCSLPKNSERNAQFLHALRQRHVQTLPEIGDAVADDRRLGARLDSRGRLHGRADQACADLELGPLVTANACLELLEAVRALVDESAVDHTQHASN